MTARDLLDELRSEGVSVVAEIDLDGPDTALTEDRIALARRLKPQMLRLLFGPLPPSHVLNLPANAALLDAWCPLPMFWPALDYL